MAPPDFVIEITESPDLTITVEEQTGEITTLEVASPPEAVEISIPGPAGPPGPQGPQGTPGAGGDLYYLHQQTAASTLWTIDHMLGKYPAVQVKDSSGRQVYGEVTHLSTNTTRAEFSSAFSGEAFCN
jgi:hypothetical protein